MSIQETPSPPSDIFVGGHFTEQYGYAVHRSHGSGNWFITYTVEGQGCYCLRGEEIRASPGDIILLKPDTPHDYSVPFQGTWDFWWAHFQPRIDWWNWWNLPEHHPGLFKVTLRTSLVRERATQVFQQLHTDSSTFLLQQNQDAHSLPTLQRELALNQLEALLLLAAMESSHEARHSFDPRVQQVLASMTRDLRAPHTVETLAREVALSPSRLAHLFKEEVGTSLVNTLLTLRLQQAARLLTFTQHSISTIAEEVGFRSAFYFSRQFRQRFGISPSAYRAIQQ